MACPVRVSVCIPTYNGATFLAESIQSVLAQTFSEFELLIVDDGSTDATVDIVRSFSDERVRLYQNEERLGIPKNWNRCLSFARGEFFCLFHQDDLMMPENLARKVQMLEAEPRMSFVHSGATLLVDDSAPSSLGNWIDEATEDFIADGMAYFRKLLFPGNVICAPAVMARRDTFLALGGFDEDLAFTPDYEMWMKASVAGCVGFLSDPLITYRWHGSNAQHTMQQDRKEEELIIAQRRAVQFYVERTGRVEEGSMIQAAVDLVGSERRRLIQLERYVERQQAYVKELEAQRDQLWADAQQVGKGWEAQTAHIESQEKYIKELETLRDNLWSEMQQVGKSWETQKAHIEAQQHYVTQLERQRDDLTAARERLTAEQTLIGAECGVLRAERDRLVAELARRLPERLVRVARRTWARALTERKAV
jgi:GT2 family glycosyltransferase